MSSLKKFIVTPRPTPRLEKLLLLSKSNDGIKRGSLNKGNTHNEEVYQECVKSIKPICDYLDNQGLENGKDYGLPPSQSCVIISLTPKQVDTLRQQPYVLDVSEDEENKACSK